MGVAFVAATLAAVEEFDDIGHAMPCRVPSFVCMTCIMRRVAAWFLESGLSLSSLLETAPKPVWILMDPLPAAQGIGPDPPWL